MVIIRSLSLQVVTVTALMSLINGRIPDTVRSTSCRQQSFYHPRYGNISCTRVCPPTLSTDINVRFCSINCDAYYECLRSELPVLSADTTSNSSCPASWFYHPRHGFVDCRLVCTTTAVSQYCQINCPLYYRCMTQSQS